MPTLSVRDSYLPWAARIVLPSQVLHEKAIIYGGRAVAISFLVDRKSTRLNSSHDQISYAVFCLKKKNKLKHLGWNRKRQTCSYDHFSITFFSLIKNIQLRSLTSTIYVESLNLYTAYFI